ncbi:MAG: hypothetical protein GX557_06435 [Chloroflexi bacterium]|nr:hypothetical protein [Chloroflexota bacterium]
MALSAAAAQLNVTPALVESMLDTLTQMGFLAEAPLSCDTSQCGACGLCKPAGASLRTWTVTAKGRAARWPAN